MSLHANAPLESSTPKRARGRPTFALPRAAAFWLIGCVLALLLFSSTTPSPLYVVYQHRWHFSTTVLTVVFAVYAVAVLLALVAFGSLSDAVGRRPVLVAALVVVIASMVLFMVSDGVGWLLAARALQGFAVGGATGALGAALIELAPAGAPGRGTLVNACAPTIGMATGALGAGLLVQYAPYPTVLPYLLLLVVFGCALGGVLSMSEPAPRTPGTRVRPSRVAIPRSIRRPFALLALGVVAVWALGGLYLSLGPSLAEELLHSSNHLLGGIVVTVLAGLAAVAQLALGHWSARRATVTGSVLLLVGLGLVVLALTLRSAGVFFAGTAVLGLGWGATFLGAFRAIAALADPAHRSELLAAVYVVAYLAMSLPAIGAGVAVGYVGLHETVTIFALGVAVLVLAALAGLPAARRAPVPEAARVAGHGPCPCAVPTAEAQRAG